MIAAGAMLLACSAGHQGGAGGAGGGNDSGQIGGAGGRDSGSEGEASSAQMDGASGDDSGVSDCPALLDDPTGKVQFSDYLQSRPTAISDVTIWLRAERLPALPSCPEQADEDARCPTRDDALIRRQSANARQVTCTLSGLQGFRLNAVPIWYESPHHLTNGLPAPVLLGFNVGIDAAQIQRAAANPDVAKIDPAPGTAFATGYIPPLPTECAADDEVTDAVRAKVATLASVTATTRQPVMVEVTDSGALPPIATCDTDVVCQAQLNSLWDRTILNTRQITCIKRRLNQSWPRRRLRVRQRLRSGI